MGVGTDYGMGESNIDKETGIRYGVIPEIDVLEAWSCDSDPYYGESQCPDCNSESLTPTDHGYLCNNCEMEWDDEDVFSNEPLSWCLDKGGYIAQCDTYGDIFVIKSPYYTHAQFCSPCDPGAGHLQNPMEDGVKTYCFDPSWFMPVDDGEITGEFDGEPTSCPYPVYKVDSGECVFKPIR